MAKKHGNVPDVEMVGATAELFAVADLIGYDRKTKKHPSEQIKAIVASVNEFGWTVPVLVDRETRTIIAGEARLKVAQDMGLDMIPVIWADGWSKAKQSAYRLADNKLSELSTWDMDAVLAELRDIIDADFNASLTGFDVDAMLAELDANEGNGDADAEAPPPPVEPVTVPGDVWVLGRHRLMCGSSTIADDVTKLLNGVEPHLMVTDPPYGVEYDPTWRDDAGGKFGNGKTKMRGKVENDDKADWREAWALFPGDVAYVWSAPGPLQVDSFASLAESGFEVRYQIIWRKSHFVLSRGDYHWQHEPCWYAVRKGKKHHWSGDRTQSSIWDIAGMNPAGRNRDDGNEKTEHGTQKPVECMKRPIENNSSPGQAVYEPFSGSGTTIIAGEMTARHVYAMELSPAYVDVAVKRWQTFSGKIATLEGDGRTFDELAAERLGSSVSFPRDPMMVEGGIDTP